MDVSRCLAKRRAIRHTIHEQRKYERFLRYFRYNPDFEDNQPPVPAKEFIARTTQWLQKNLDKPSAEIPTTVDKNPDGPTIYSGGRDEGHMNGVVKGHNELARKILAKYPEVTHFGFN